MRVRAIFAALVLLPHLVIAPAAQRQDQEIERLRRDQAEILRKAERLRDVMGRLLVQYDKDGRVEQAKLLRAGMEHLESSNVLEDVAGIRNDLDAEAFARAIDKQAEVVEDLRRLLDILLDRRSLENLDKEIATAERLAADADQLLQRQQDLRAQSQEVARAGGNNAEDQLAEQLRELANKERNEAQNNQRQAGSRLPYLEDALARVRRLLERQGQLEKAADRQTSGADDARREQSFRLGDLGERGRELIDSERRQQEWERAGELAAELERVAAGDDAQARERAMQRLHDVLERLARSPRGEDGQATRDAADQVAKAAANDAKKQALAEAAKQAGDLAKARADEHRTATQQQSRDLQKALEQAANDLTPENGKKPASAGSLDEARKQLGEAEKAEAEGRTEAAQSALARAARAMSEARQKFEAANPDAAKVADEMAAESAQAARSLRGSPQGDRAEENAAQRLDAAERAQRAAADGLEQRQDAAPEVAKSREALEQAKADLEQAIASEADRPEVAQAAAERQAALQAQAKATQQGLEQAAQSGDVSPQQAKATGERMQRATQAMERAQKSLQRGEQATAAEQQRQAAEELQQAEQALRRSRGLNEQQKEQMDKLADEQKQLEDDIMRLAREVEKRRNRAASQALQQANESSRKAKEAMERAEPEETDQQQQQTEEALQRAKDALEEERDRYMDLRQEELLFKIREELEQFLAKQVAISQRTAEAAAELAQGARMTRPMRRRLNELGDREQELVARASFMSEALQKEEEVVYSQVLGAIGDDLTDVARRLGGAQPNPGEYTQAVQDDVRDRLVDLIEALKREQQRRQEERQNQQQQQQQQGRNQQARKPLVPFRAELEMLKRLEQDVLRRLESLQQLVKAAGADGVSETEFALIERLGHRHTAITRTFLQLKDKIEAAMQAQDQQQGADKEEGNPGRGR
ncbi:MAG: hypothetical protein R3F56_06590 [Planctomycetota bacterium]